MADIRELPDGAGVVLAIAASAVFWAAVIVVVVC